MNENEYDLGIFSIWGFGAVRTLLTEEGKFFFCSMDAAYVLGYSDLRKTLADYCEEKGMMEYETFTYIDEDNMHRLIAHSKHPDIERFESWVFDNVIPDFRRRSQDRKENRK